MKRTVLIFLVVLSGTVSASAQVYLGGSFGLSSTVAKSGPGSETTAVSFTFAPEAGYSLTDKFDLGLSILLGSTSNSANQTTIAYAFAPYVRYSLIEFDRFRVLGKAASSIGGGTTKYGETSKAITTAFRLSVSPILMYDLSNHFALLANLNLFSLNLSSNSSRSGSTDLGSTTSFNFGVDSNNIASVGSSSGLTIGFAYKF